MPPMPRDGLTANDFYRPSVHKQWPPFLQLCEALCSLEDGWASLRLMATCRNARDDARNVRIRLKQALRDIRESMYYVLDARPLLPGFDPSDDLDISMELLTVWEPQAQPSLRARPPQFMQDAFTQAAEEHLHDWIRSKSRFRGLQPMSVLWAMNATRQDCRNFNALAAILVEGTAQFFYSPLVRDQSPMRGPGLIIAVRYCSFPFAICARYTTMNYMQKVFVPWFNFLPNNASETT